jgi:F-type H+-transporting ATPase subunit delta
LNAMAERYASALLDVTMAHGDAEKVKTNLVEFAAVVGDSKDLQNFLANPAVPKESKRIVLRELLNRIGSTVTMQNFLNVVVDHRRGGLLPEIAEAYTRKLNTKLGIAEAAVTSANELSSTERTGLVSALEPELLGGASVRIGSVIYDGSVREQLRRLEAELATE